MSSPRQLQLVGAACGTQPATARDSDSECTSYTCRQGAYDHCHVHRVCAT